MTIMMTDFAHEFEDQPPLQIHAKFNTEPWNNFNQKIMNMEESWIMPNSKILLLQSECSVLKKSPHK